MMVRSSSDELFPSNWHVRCVDVDSRPVGILADGSGLINEAAAFGLSEAWFVGQAAW
jgi:hypothetical protein